tara:strand:+ start:2274 stop:2672 length:399 start_codon:yes stop_codon:yes gene_type:complete
MIEDNINFINEKTFPKLMEIFGWEIKPNYQTYNGLVITRADFYPIGHVLGYSSKAIIECDGESVIELNGVKYYDFLEIVDDLGIEEAIKSFPSWNVIVEKQWAIRKSNKEGKIWVGAFSNLSELPYRKSLRC